MLVMVRYLLMFGVVRHCGSLTRAEHPLISESLLRSSSESKSEKCKRHTAHLCHNVCACLLTLYV